MRHKNFLQCIFMFLTLAMLTSCSRQSEFDRNFEKNCVAASSGNTGYCTCALQVIKRNIKAEALPALSGSDIQKLAPEILTSCPVE
ncbi:MULTISPECIES: hypothetical protein [Achromobacter]|nr:MULTISPECIES: hypothetical protein [Achromobacter]MDH0682230.1 hypothetical protein [Achromobacter animicus]